MSFSFSSLAEVGNEYPVHGHNEMLVEKSPNGKKYPMGGTANFLGGKGLYIKWQDGPVDRENGQEPNGCFIEDVLEVCRIRLEHYQDSSFACAENARAIENIKSAVRHLTARHKDRKARGVLGKNEK